MSLGIGGQRDLPPSAGPRSPARLVAHLSTTLVVGLAAVVLGGWALRVEAAVRLAPFLPPMLPATAVALLLLGAALGGRRWTAVRVGLGSAALALGIIFILRDIAGAWSGFDRLVPPPWQLPPLATVAAFLLLAIAVLWLPTHPVRAQALATGASAVAASALAGILFGAPGDTAMPAHTAIAVALLVVGIYGTTADAGLARLVRDRGTAGVTLRRTLPIVFLLPLGLAWLQRQGVASGWWGDGFSMAVLVIAVASIAGAVVVGMARALARAEGALETQARDLERSHEALDTITRTLAHDARGPLRRVRSFAEILQEEHAFRLDAAAQDCVRRILGAAGRLDRLVRGLLAYSHTAARPVTLQPVSWNDVVDQALRHLDAQVRASCAAVTVGPDLGSVKGDPALLCQIATNLISNALKFAEAGKRPVVEIVSRRRNGTIRLVVRDQGIGIPPAQRRRLFRPVPRLHPRSASAGSGLGLAIVGRAASRLGGTCGVESVLGEGTDIWVELPAAGTDEV